MLISKFIDWLKINKQYAASTVTTYNRILHKFDSEIKELSLNARGVEDSEKLTINDVEYFIWREKIRWKSARTCNSYLAVIRDFLQFCERNHEKVMNYREILLMKECRKKIDALTENEAQRLLNFTKSDMSKDELTKTRDQAIISVLLFTGLRVSELCNIKVWDIKQELQVIWKNNTLRLVYLFSEHLALINLYLFLREWQHIESEYLFCSHANNSKGHKLSRVTVESIVRDAWERAGITDPVWPHKLRHTFATSILRRWWNIYYIKELLGHQHISTTQTYLSATNEDLRKTQYLLQQGSNRSLEENLMPMPENVIIKDSNLFDKFRNSVYWIGNQINNWFQQINNWMNWFQQWFWRGVANYWFWY